MKQPILYALCQECYDAGYEISCHELNDVRYCQTNKEWLCEECFTADPQCSSWKEAITAGRAALAQRERN